VGAGDFYDSGEKEAFNVWVLVSDSCVRAKWLGEYFAVREVLPFTDCVNVKVVKDRCWVGIVYRSEGAVGVFAQRGSRSYAVVVA
jgi:hypothetical protein